MLTSLISFTQVIEGYHRLKKIEHDGRTKHVFLTHIEFTEGAIVDTLEADEIFSISPIGVGASANTIGVCTSSGMYIYRGPSMGEIDESDKFFIPTLANFNIVWLRSNELIATPVVDSLPVLVLSSQDYSIVDTLAIPSQDLITVSSDQNNDYHYTQYSNSTDSLKISHLANGATQTVRDTFSQVKAILSFSQDYLVFNSLNETIVYKYATQTYQLLNEKFDAASIGYSVVLSKDGTLYQLDPNGDLSVIGSHFGSLIAYAHFADISIYMDQQNLFLQHEDRAIDSLYIGKTDSTMTIFFMEIYGSLGEKKINDNALEIFPNPISNKFEIKANFLSDASSISILNLSGETLATLQYNTDEQIDITSLHLKSGMYIIQAIYEFGSTSRKIMIE